MRTLAIKSAELTPARKKAEKPSASIAPQAGQSVTASDGLMIQRKAACACGGGCPRCQQGSSHPLIRTKLAMSTPGDQYEQEAERVAATVMGLTDSPRTNLPAASTRTRSAPQAVQRAATETAAPPSGERPADFDVVPGAGQPLPVAVRDFFEPRFGYDLSGVRVHTDPAAAAAAAALHTHAYTVGRDVVFGAGRYAPETDEGKRLLAHELTHTIQQSDDARKATDNAAHGAAPAGAQAGAVALHSGPQIAGFWPFDSDEETIAFKSVEAEVNYRLDKNETAEDKKAYEALNGQSVPALLATLEKLKTRSLLGTLIGRFDHATGVNRPRLWIAFSAVQYKGWGGAEESLKTEIAAMRANNEGAQVDEMLAYRKQPDPAELAAPAAAAAPVAPTGEKKEAKKAGATKGDAGVIEKIKTNYDEHIAEASKQYGLTKEMLRAIIATESKGDPDASSGAAFGLMQVTKGTWEGTRKLDENLKDYDFETYWKDPKVNILFGASVLKSNMKAMGVKADDPNSAKLAVVAYNAGLGTVKAAIALAKEGGSASPEADCLKPEYMKPAIKSTGIHSYYLTGSGRKSNPEVKEVKPDPANAKKHVVVPVEGSTLEKAEEKAVELKYNEVSQYPDKVSNYMAAQTAAAPAGDKAADPAAGADTAAEPAKLKLEKFPLSDKLVEIVKESDQAKTLKVEESPATYVKNVLTNAKIDYDDFYKNFTTITFFGHTVSPAIHKDFAEALKKIETDAAKGKTPKAAGEALGVKSVGGSRDYPTSAAFSMHLVGMAVDINYTDSPFIGSSASDVFGRAGLLVDGTAYSYDGGAHTYEQLAPMQKAITAYFALLDDATKLEEKLKAPAKTEWSISKANKGLALAKSWDGMTADLAKKQIQADLSFIAKRWERTEEQIKKQGFLGVSKDLVDAMTKGNATNWGGGSYGDIMHFDMRTQGKGAAINSAFNTYKATKTTEAQKAYTDEGEEARKTRRAAEKAAAEEKAAAKKAKKAKK